MIHISLINLCLCFLFLKDRAEKPYITISGERRVGQSVKVQCSVYHTCVTNPPNLLLSIKLNNHRLDTTLLSNGLSKTTLTTMLKIERDLQTVECSVYHTGGLTAKSSTTFNAACMWWDAQTLKKFIFLVVVSTTLDILQAIFSP